MAEVVRNCMDKRTATDWIAKESETEISVGDRARFIEIVEIELSSLHEGNFARYRVRPLEFHEWIKVW